MLENLDALIRDGRYNEAEQAARAALASLDAMGEDAALESALITDRLVAVLWKGSKPGGETLRLANRSLETKQRLLGPDDIETARSKLLLGQVLGSSQEAQSAQRLLEEALDVSIRVAGPASLDTASIRMALGRQISYSSQYEPAREQFLQALAVREAVLGADDPSVAETLSALGLCAAGVQDDAAAEELFGRALGIYERAGLSAHPDVGFVLKFRGQIARRKGDYEQASAYLERSIGVIEAALGPDNPQLAGPLSGLGLVQTETGDYALATRSFERSLSLLNEAFGSEYSGLAPTLGNYAYLRLRMGDAAKAESLFAEAARLSEKHSGTWNANTASLNEGRGIALVELGRLAEAEPYLARSLEIRIRVLGEAHPMVAMSLHNLSLLNGEMGDFAEQKSYAERSLATLDRLGNTNNHYRGLVMNSLGHAHRNLGLLDEALEYSNGQLEAMRKAFGPFHPEVARALRFRSHLLAELGRHDEAIAAAVACEALSRDHVELTVRATTESEALSYSAARLSSLGLLVTLATGDTAAAPAAASAAWDAAIRGRALVLNELIARRQVSTRVHDAELAGLRAALTDTSAHLAKLTIGGSEGADPSSYVERVEAARQEKERAERAYAGRNEQFRSLLGADRAGLAEVTEGMPADAVLVGFLQYGEVDIAWPAQRPPPDSDASTPAYAAFVLRSGSQNPMAVRLGPADQINGLVTRFRAAIANETLAGARSSATGEADYRSAAAELRARVWDPVAAAVDGATEIFIVPDGALNLVDFAVLPVANGQYLAEVLPPLHYLSTERDVLMDPPAAAGDRLLALGAPDFESAGLFAALENDPLRMAMADDGATGAVYRGPRSACGSFQAMAFEPLPAASREITEVSKLWRDAGSAHTTELFSGADASETAFKLQAGGKRVLHLATHGFFLGGDCGSAANPQEDSDVTSENPLLLSGLALAGANHRAAAGPDEDDGILTAEEIATLDLGGTEWAVLSACDTGGGEIRAGEGVLGLQRAFRLAGARTVIMSLWPVEDEVTRRWMAALYRHHFTAGLGTMQSVRAASLELLQARRDAGLSTHPFYWAGFVASGDWR